MKRKITSFLLLASVLFSMCVTCVSASAVKVSYGIDVITNSLELKKSVNAGETLNFSAEDFSEFTGSESVSSITVLTLPDAGCGTLALSGIPVMKNQIISLNNIDKLSFVPSAEQESECTFVFGVMSESQPLEFTCRICLTVPEGYIPSSGVIEEESVSVSTIADIPMYNRLVSSDGGETRVYRITSYPEHGTLNMLDSSTGYFRYTPVEGFVGEDRFDYVSVDPRGRESTVTHVTVSVEKCTVDICYCDMDGEPSLLAAMRMAEKGIMVGKTVCNVAYFDPDGSVRRDEFLAMAMNIAGINLGISPDASTGFDDNGSIPTYLRGYVAYALDNGYISGVFSSGRNLFSPASAVKVDEAAVMIYNILGISPSGEREVFADGESIPDWACEAMTTLADAGILGTVGYVAYDRPLTRAQAAEMLLAMSAFIEQSSKQN